MGSQAAPPEHTQRQSVRPILFTMIGTPLRFSSAGNTGRKVRPNLPPSYPIQSLFLGFLSDLGCPLNKTLDTVGISGDEAWKNIGKFAENWELFL